MTRLAVFSGAVQRGVFATVWSLFSAFTGGFGTELAAADPTVGVDRAMEALAKTCFLANKIQQDSAELGLYEDGPYLVGTRLTMGQSRSGKFTFQRKVEYALVGWGDNDARDVDIIVRDSDGSVVAMDVATDATPIVRFSVPRSGDYSVELKLHAPDTAGDCCFCCFIVLEEDGWSVPLSNCVDAIVNLEKVADYVVRHEDGNVRIANGDCWGVSGIVLKEGQFYSSTNLNLEDGRHVLIGAGDGHARDLDNTVQSPGGTTLGKDEAADQYPITAFRSNGTSVNTAISMPKSTGASLVLQSMLKVD